jgi:hypothetical protein
MPAAFQFARHEAVGGIDEIILPPSPLDLIGRFLQRQGQRLPFGVVCCGHPCECFQRRVDTGGLERL